MDDVLAPGLYLVATPLGNLGDLSPRAREILSRASFIAGESTKVVLRWLEMLTPEDDPEWKRPGVLSYRESSREGDARTILRHLAADETVALISDAGTPGISDPGWHLVEQARASDFPVWSIPGPCAAISALAASGFPSRRFSFEGFLPSSGSNRRQALEALGRSVKPCILYESPHRFLKTLDELARHCSDREIFVSREMTKKFEENWRGAISTAPSYWAGRTIKGEFTLVLGPGSVADDSDEGDSLPPDTLLFLKGLNLPTKTATAIVMHFFPSLSKKDVYRAFSRDDTPRD